MADNWHVRWLREGVRKWNKRRKKVAFVPDLSGLRFFDLLPNDFRDKPKTSRYFEKIDLSGANLRGADLSRLNFAKAKFKHAMLLNADLSKSNFKDADFTRADLVGSSFDESYLAGALFDRPTIANVTFDRANGSGATFIGADLGSAERATLTSIGARIFASRHEYLSEVIEKKDKDNLSAMVETKHDSTKKKYKNRYDVVFATNRNPIISRGEITDFGTKNSQKLSFGVCEVIVPETHRMGSLGSPMWKRLLNRSDDRLKLQHLIILNEELFGEFVRSIEARMRLREKPTIFVHGYNTSFKESVIRAAQLGFDLGIGQGIGLFSWPSLGKIHGYLADEASCEASKYYLADFIEKFVRISKEESVNIISHSMGCRCVMNALEVLSNGRKEILKKVNQIILAAADVDTAIMPNLARHAVGQCARTTSYVSDGDKALAISGWFHNFPRVGVMPPPYVLNGMDTIAVNDKELGDLSHGYFSTSRTVLSDIFTILKHNSPPSDRHSIEEAVQDNLLFWRLRN
ncbi:alpha/beta hydrolase [Nitratireductor mangrovi]|uniref:Alpha/beta hydrolase n=1 Tax=Nitratireductor mangrovi TaxID=2599600 RepID=A0A5B8L5M6_9HYPH|nr:alpha/beta hydrolase [Nitratireductor mangrovi]QDZ03043.1 alpha/beta hydrolase [Nitratireductor mangrovi]